MLTELFSAARDFVTGLPEAFQGIGVFLVSLVPFVEGEGAALIAVILGMDPWLAVPVAILGNVLAVGLLIAFGAGARRAVVARSAARRDAAAAETSTPPAGTGQDASEEKLRRRFEAWGVAGLSLLGPLFFIPGHVVAPAMVSFGASPRRVMVWQVVAIVLYTAFTAAVAYLLGAQVLGTLR